MSDEVYFQSIILVIIVQASHARIAAPKTLLGLPELTLGVIPGSGGMNSSNILFVNSLGSISKETIFSFH